MTDRGCCTMRHTWARDPGEGGDSVMLCGEVTIIRHKLITRTLVLGYPHTAMRTLTQVLSGQLSSSTSSQ